MDDLLTRAKQVMPGGVSSPVRSLKAVNGSPLIVVAAKGAKLKTIDGRYLIDYCMSFGPLILGHSTDAIVNKIIDQAEKGTSYGTLTMIEVELAEKIVECHPAVDWVRFVNSGTEAVMSALRLARGKTGRELIVKFDGTYHGHVDSMLVKSGSGLATLGIGSSAGIPDTIAKKTLVLPLGDKDALIHAFEEYGDKIAAVIIEGVPANNGLLVQSHDFLHFIQRKCKQHGCLFILDEVITGFRLGLGGATEYYGLKPDIVTLGKIIGGGLPIGAYGGRKDLMELIAPLGNVYQAGTLSGNPLVMVAGNATLDVLRETPSIYGTLRNRTGRLVNELSGILMDKGYPITSSQVESMFWFVFDQPDRQIRGPSQVSKDAIANYAKFHAKLLENGIYFPPSAFEVAFLSLAHTDEVILETLEKIRKGL